MFTYSYVNTADTRCTAVCMLKLRDYASFFTWKTLKSSLLSAECDTELRRCQCCSHSRAVHTVSLLPERVIALILSCAVLTLQASIRIKNNYRCALIRHDSFEFSKRAIKPTPSILDSKNHSTPVVS